MAQIDRVYAYDRVCYNSDRDGPKSRKPAEVNNSVTSYAAADYFNPLVLDDTRTSFVFLDFFSPTYLSPSAVTASRRVSTWQTVFVYIHIVYYA